MVGMISAYILINMKRGYSDEAVKKLRNIEGVAKVSMIAGEYDIVTRVQVEKLKNLIKVTNKIHSITGVENTETHVIEKEISDN